jgi:hypothetical protein
MRQPAVHTGLIGLSVLAVLAAVLTLFASADNTQAGVNYSTTGNTYMENCLPTNYPGGVSDPDLQGDGVCNVKVAAASANSNITTTLSVPAGNSNFGSPVITLNNPAFIVAADAAIANGQKVAGLSSATTLGVFGGQCVTTPIVDILLYDSSVSGSLATNPEGTSDRWSTVAASGSGGGGASGVINNNGGPLGTDLSGDDLADSDEPFVGTNLDIYGPVFDPGLDYPGGPDAPGTPVIVPRARYTGATRVPGATGDWQLLSFFTFNGGALAPFAADSSNAPHPFGYAGSSIYTATVSLLNDVTATLTSPGTVTDFCAPLDVTTATRGTSAPAGTVRSTNPSSTATYEVFQYSTSFRDDDGDGFENQFDTCPTMADNHSDTDGDVLQNACDTSGFDTDEDNDGFLNGQDNCPKVANGGAAQVDSEQQEEYSSASTDGGPKTDGIGDACDANPTTSSNEGGYIADINVMTVCIGGTDTDADGICNADEATYSADADFDGFSNAREAAMGTDPNDRCTNHPDPADTEDPWPADLNQTQNVDILDVLQLKPVFGVVSARHDLNASGGGIDILDVLQLKPVFNALCGDHIFGRGF